MLDDVDPRSHRALGSLLGWRGSLRWGCCARRAITASLPPSSSAWSSSMRIPRVREKVGGVVSITTLANATSIPLFIPNTFYGTSTSN